MNELKSADTSNTVQKPIRYYFMDNLRVVLTFFVVIGHSAITYGAAGSWFYQESADLITIIIFSWLGSIGQSFAMILFFFLAGYFEPSSLDKKGVFKFLVERLIKLGLPLLLFTFFLYALITWMTDRVVLGLEISFIDDYIYNFTRGNFNTGPLWFLLYLLIFTSIYAIGYKFIHLSRTCISRIKIKDKSLVFFILGLGILTFIIRIWFPQTEGIASINWLGIQIGTIFQYTLSFILGIFAYRFHWLPQFTSSLGKRWIIVATISAFFIPVLTVLSGAIDNGPSILLGGFNWSSFLFALNEVCLGVAICTFLLSWSQNHFNNHGKWAQLLSKHTYAVYIVHAVFVVGIAMLFRSLTWHPLVKFVLLSVSALFASYFFVILIKKIPLFNRIF